MTFSEYYFYQEISILSIWLLIGFINFSLEQSVFTQWELVVEIESSEHWDWIMETSHGHLKVRIWIHCLFESFIIYLDLWFHHLIVILLSLYCYAINDATSHSSFLLHVFYFAIYFTNLSWFHQDAHVKLGSLMWFTMQVTMNWFVLKLWSRIALSWLMLLHFVCGTKDIMHCLWGRKELEKKR